MWAQIKAAKWAIVAGLWLATFAAGLFFGFQWSRAGSASREASLASKQLDALAENQKALQKTLDRLPKAERKHADVVRANPAGCDRPVPVSRSLQERTDEANAARALPRNP